MSKNARVSRRADLRLPATVTMIDESRHAAHTLDLSQGGVSLQTASQIRLAQYCAVSFQVAIGEERRTVLAMGQVVYSDPDPELGYKTGVQFIKIDQRSVAVIEELLAAPA
ncbi:PilZ domain-containing protein [Rugamonas sp. CCM 8940]|uniref:PilZ domain-containing protein n=1 Tax=Rugamonas sp. CCM 8940 TaxID=2765359 RepID=UPI0018F5C2EB|nr:PilZ domain-containing protein [Rugamonas sp. CCM 8940]MBJ7311567.1 PilZ domain-containing protein [Rugamonas sp. CCM 8940]